jgi:LCP family protein required for cell wall assembly
MSSSSLKRRLWIGGAVIAVLLLGAGAVFAALTWGEVNRVSIERPSDADPGGPVAQPEEPEEEPAEEDPQDEFEVVDPGNQVFLLVGSDSREDLDDTEGFGDFTGDRADVIMVLFKEADQTGLLSIPRDLLVESPCGGRDNRINAMLEGCGDFNGPTSLTIAVEELIGHPVDHFALVDLAGFQEAVDVLGGFEICVENPVRDLRSHLDLDAGCTIADGEQTLAWLRSRRTQELTEDGWRTMEGMSDLVRNERQREFLIEMMGRASDLGNPQDMLSTARTVAPFVTVDTGLSMMDAVNLALTMRGIDSGRVVEMEVPVRGTTTDNGAEVLVPATPVDEIVAEFLSAAAAASGIVLGVNG